MIHWHRLTDDERVQQDRERRAHYQAAVKRPLNAASHVHYMICLAGLTGQLRGIEAYAPTIKDPRWPLKCKTKALIEFDRRITGTD